MSEFEVKIVRIDSVEKHPNADRLSIMVIGGYNCISANLEDGTPRYKAGDLVVYIPEAAILPDWMLKRMGFWDEINQCGTLSGVGKNRVKAIKLRQVVSQGILYPVYYNGLDSYYITKTDDGYNFETKSGRMDVLWDVNLDQDVAEFLEITKYEPTIPAQMRGVLGALYGFTKSYDIESLQKFNKVFDDGEEVVITEKVHGSLAEFGFIHESVLPEDKRDLIHNLGNGWYCFSTSKGLAKSGMVQMSNDANGENVYFKNMLEVISNGRGVEITKYMVDSHHAKDRFYIFGEIIGPGIQKGYSYDQKNPTFRVFDVYIGEQNFGSYLGDLKLTNFCINFRLDRVPVLYRGPFSMDIAVEMRDGKTVAGNQVHIREGCVIRTVVEMQYKGLPDNRKQTKFVSPEYLLKSDGEEIN